MRQIKRYEKPDRGYDIERKQLADLWWDEPKLVSRCEAQTLPMPDAMGRKFIARCSIESTNSTEDGRRLCTRHFKRLPAVKYFDELVR